MSGEDRRAGCWLAAEQRMKAALEMVPLSRSPVPPEYWQLLAEAQTLATLASAPYDVAIPLAFHELDERREREADMDAFDEILKRKGGS